LPGEEVAQERSALPVSAASTRVTPGVESRVVPTVMGRQGFGCDADAVDELVVGAERVLGGQAEHAAVVE
jgi:hypothetical protein